MILRFTGIIYKHPLLGCLIYLFIYHQITPVSLDRFQSVLLIVYPLPPSTVGWEVIGHPTAITELAILKMSMLDVALVNMAVCQSCLYKKRGL